MRAPLVAMLVFAASCYRPEPAPGSFRCSPDLGGLCPSGLLCSHEGVCVRAGDIDMGSLPLDLAGDQSALPFARTCDDQLQAGAFTNLTPLSAANTPADEEHLALDPSTTAPRLLFQRGNQLFAAAISTSDPKSISAPQVVTLTGGPATLNGGSFGSDGTLWLSGTDVGGTGLYAGTSTGLASFTMNGPQAPISATCAFSDPFVQHHFGISPMYAAFPLAGCSGASYVVSGAVGRNLAAFYSALPDSSWAAPSLSPSTLTLLVSSTGADRHLYAAPRSDPQYQFGGTSRVYMPALGEATEDRQAVVSADCHTIYFSSVRSGGAGGADLYAADIAAQ
jgi:hypothetical protein